MEEGEGMQVQYNKLKDIKLNASCLEKAHIDIDAMPLLNTYKELTRNFSTCPNITLGHFVIEKCFKLFNEGPPQ